MADATRHCPICGAELPGGMRRVEELRCPACGVDVGPLIDLGKRDAKAAAPTAQHNAASRPPERNAWVDLLRTALIGAAAGAIVCGAIGAPLGLVFNVRVFRAALAGAQFGALLGVLFGIVWSAIERFERPVLAAPLIAVPGALFAGLVNHAMLTAGGTMPDLTLFESLEVSLVTGIAGGLIAGALKQR